jgi:hypothetical protein
VAQRTRDLAAQGIAVDGCSLVKAADAQNAEPPLEPRDVRIVVDGNADRAGSRLIVAGSVEGVMH